MKYLSDYTQEPISKMLDKNGAFFAFSDKQFDEAMDKALPKSDYCHLFGGLIAPKKNADTVLLELAEINKNAVAQDIADNGIIKIILRELNNHEAYYTRDVSSTADALAIYGLTTEQITKVFKNKNTTAEDINYKHE